MNSQQKLTIQKTGTVIKINNALRAATSAVFAYTIKGVPATVNLIVQGVKNNGDIVSLDTYTTVANTTRTVSLSDTYDFFYVFGAWTGGTDVSVDVVASLIGPGALASSAFQSVMTGTGSPQGVHTASPGGLYVDLNGGAGATLWVKESGTGNTGWVAK